MDKNNDNFFEEKPNQVEQKKDENALATKLAYLFVGVVIGCISGVLIAATIKAILWMF